jgi:hypothetical protein
VLTGNINHNEVINDLSEYLNRKIEEKSIANDPYQIANNGWWYLSEPDLHTTIAEMETNFLAGKYKAHMCIMALHLILKYTQELDCEVGHPDKLFAFLKESIQNGSIEIDLEYDNFSFFNIPTGNLKDSYKEQFDNYISELKTIEMVKKESTVIETINLFDTDNWSSRFYESIITNNIESEFIDRHAFLALIDVDALLKKINIALGEDYTNLLNVFRSVYHFSNLYDFFSADIPNLEKLIEGMRIIKREDRMVMRCHNYVLESLENWLQVIRTK